MLGVDLLGSRLMPGNPVLWRRGVKVFSNIIVIILNYVFSKWFIFRKKKAE